MSTKFKSLDLDPGVTVELTKEIETIDIQMRALRAGRLQETTLIGLIATDSGVSPRSVKKVLDAMSNLRKKHVKP